MDVRVVARLGRGLITFRSTGPVCSAGPRGPAGSFDSRMESSETTMDELLSLEKDVLNRKEEDFTATLLRIKLDSFSIEESTERTVSDCESIELDA